MRKRKTLKDIIGNYLLLLFACLFLSSCSSVKYFPKYSFSSPNGQYLIEGDRSQKLLTIRKAATGKLLKLWGSEVIEKASCLSFTLDEKHLAIAAGKTVYIWDVDNKRLKMSIVENSRVVFCGFSLDDTTLCTGMDNQKISLWDVRTGKQLWNVRFNRDLDSIFSVFSYRMAFGPDFLVAGGIGLIEVYNLSYGRILRRFVTDKPSFMSTEFHISTLGVSPYGKYLAAGFHDKTIMLADVKSGRKLWRKPAHNNPPRKFAFHPDGRYLLSGTTDVMADTRVKNWELKIWDVRTGKEVAKKTGLDVVGVSKDGRIFTRAKNTASLVTYYWGSNWIEEAKGDVLEDALQEFTKQVAKEMYTAGFERLTVTEFRSQKGKMSRFEKHIRKDLVTKISSDNDLSVVESTLMRQALNELKLSTHEIMEPNHIRQFGNLTGADAVLTGTVTDLGGKVKINARLMATETGEVFAVLSIPVFKDGQVRAMLEKGPLI